LLEEAPVCPNNPAPGLAGAPNAGNSPGLEAAQSKQVSEYMLMLFRCTWQTFGCPEAHFKFM